MKDLQDTYYAAAEYIKYDLDGNYNGYTRANAVSAYVNDKFNINAAATTAAASALSNVISQFDWEY